LPAFDPAVIPESAAKKNSPVIGRNREANRGFSENITGHNRSLFSVTRRLFDARRAATRERACTIARDARRVRANAIRAACVARSSHRSVFRRAPLRFSSMRAFLRGKTPKMAMDFVARNRTNIKFRK